MNVKSQILIDQANQKTEEDDLAEINTSMVNNHKSKINDQSPIKNYYKSLIQTTINRSGILIQCVN